MQEEGKKENEYDCLVAAVNAAVEVALGTYGAQGKLPVTIPVFDAATKTYTEEVAFERGFGLTYDAKTASLPYSLCVSKAYSSNDIGKYP